MSEGLDGASRASVPRMPGHYAIIAIFLILIGIFVITPSAGVGIQQQVGSTEYPDWGFVPTFGSPPTYYTAPANPNLWQGAATPENPIGYYDARPPLTLQEVYS
jgi:hypothetical protein